MHTHSKTEREIEIFTFEGSLSSSWLIKNSPISSVPSEPDCRQICECVCVCACTLDGKDMQRFGGLWAVEEYIKQQRASLLFLTDSCWDYLAFLG